MEIRNDSFKTLIRIFLMVLIIGTTLNSKENNSNQTTEPITTLDGSMQTLSNIGNWSYWFWHDGLGS